MNRQVVKIVPNMGALVRPSEHVPGQNETITVTVMEEGVDKKGKMISVPTPTQKSVFRPWRMSPTMARLLGEAKSLQAGSALMLVGVQDLISNDIFVAWYAQENKLEVRRDGDTYYIQAKG